MEDPSGVTREPSGEGVSLVRVAILDVNGNVRIVEGVDTAIINPMLMNKGLKDELDIPYGSLVSKFGEPNRYDIPHDKTDAEWFVVTPQGTAAIYDYKSGKNYLGDDGKPAEENTNWHVGATEETAVLIRKTLDLPASESSSI